MTYGEPKKMRVYIMS